VANRWVTAPLHVTERVDYALRSVLLFSRHEGDYLTAKAVAEHYGMSTKMLAGVLWNLRSAEILESRPGWHGGFRLARPAQEISLSAVITAAAGGDESPLSPADRTGQFPTNSTSDARRDDTADLVDGFWRALDDHVQVTLTTFTVADLALARSLL
jgi:Rrf2 family protein